MPPPAFRRICGHPGCRTLAPVGEARCAKHPFRQGTFADPARGNAEDRGYGKAWRALRPVIAERDGYLCQPCLRAGRVTPYYAIDHIVPKAEGGTDDPANLQAICRACHVDKSLVEATRAKARTGEPVAADNYPDWLPAPACTVRLLFGPPGAGQEDHLRLHRKPGQDVIDVDLIMAELSGLPVFQAPALWLDHAIRVRNARLANLRHAHPRSVVWLVTPGAGSWRRDWWQSKVHAHSLNATLLARPATECIARIESDGRRNAEAKAQAIQAVRSWWAQEQAGSFPLP